VEYSIGWAIGEPERAAIAGIPTSGWSPAINADGGVRDGAQVAELTGLLALTGWPDGMRVIVRRERPHPGAQLSLFEERDGWRYTAFVTGTKVGALQWLEARHRAHARVEDRIRCAKDTGLRRLPSREFAINQAGAPPPPSPSTSSAGSSSSVWTATWPSPSPNGCATGSCTPRPASCAGNAAAGYASHQPGRGPPQITAAFNRIAAIPAPG
jgi:hypothetical protein